MPVSETDTSIMLSITFAETEMAPDLVNLMAFPIKLCIICRRRFSSPSTGGVSFSISFLKVKSFPAIKGSLIFKTISVIELISTGFI